MNGFYDERYALPSILEYVFSAGQAVSIPTKKSAKKESPAARCYRLFLGMLKKEQTTTQNAKQTNGSFRSRGEQMHITTVTGAEEVKDIGNVLKSLMEQSL